MFEKRPDLSPCETESILAGSNMGPPMAKAELISSTGGTSEITYIRKGKIRCTGV